MIWLSTQEIQEVLEAGYWRWQEGSEGSGRWAAGQGLPPPGSAPGQQLPWEKLTSLGGPGRQPSSPKPKKGPHVRDPTGTRGPGLSPAPALGRASWTVPRLPRSWGFYVSMDTLPNFNSHTSQCETTSGKACARRLQELPVPEGASPDAHPRSSCSGPVEQSRPAGSKRPGSRGFFHFQFYSPRDKEPPADGVCGTRWPCGQAEPDGGPGPFLLLLCLHFRYVKDPALLPNTGGQAIKRM